MTSKVKNFNARVYQSRNNSYIIALMYEQGKQIFVRKFNAKRLPSGKSIRMIKPFNIDDENSSWFMSFEEDRGEKIRVFEPINNLGYLNIKVKQ